MSDTITQSLSNFQDFIFNRIDTNQVVLLIVILLAAWLLRPLLWRLIDTVSKRLPSAFRNDKIRTVVRRVTWPLTSLGLVQLAIEIGKGYGQDSDFLEMANRLIMVWFVYQLLAAFLDANLTTAQARFWRRRVLLPFALVTGILIVFGLLGPILAWGIHIPQLNWQLTVGSILLALALLITFIVVGRWIRRVLATSFLPKAGLDPALSITISKVIAYTIMTLGVLVALGSMGVNFTTLTVIAGGLSVGLAFGLQEIVNNFVSGFIILFERSLEPGDVVEIEDNTGTVQKVGIRSTTVRTRDNIELIIPNSYFLTEIFANLTRSENLVRVRVSVGVTYNADPREVRQALLEVAAQHPQVLAEPPPTVQFRDFGESSLDFVLFVWTNQAFETPRLTSDLRYNIWDALAARNIEIPFPQRDLHLRSGVPWSAFKSSE